jgi:hypothetical protein
MHGSSYLAPSIPILHDGCITDEFKPMDCRKVKAAPPQTNAAASPVGHSYQRQIDQEKNAHTGCAHHEKNQYPLPKGARLHSELSSEGLHDPRTPENS